MKKIIKYMVLFILILIWNLIVMELNLDEIWNYGFAHNIATGLIPYKDFNMVITPLFPFMMSIFLYIFNSNMLIFHIVWAFISTFLIYIIFKSLKDKGWIIFLSLFFIFPIIMPNYNMLIYYLLILIVLAEKAKKSDYLIGILIALTILTKHTVGFFLILPSLYYIKKPKKIIKRFIGITIPISIFVIYLLFTKSLNYFIDLCILGLFDFAKENSNLLNIYVLFTFLLLIFIIFIIKKDKKNITNYYVLSFISIVFPIFDLYHFWVFFSFFLFVYLLNHNINLKINIKLFTIGLLILMPFMYLENRFKEHIIYPNRINKFEYRFLSKNEINYTNKIISFMNKNNNRKIINLDADSYYFKIVTNKKIEKLDLINRGNWGYNGKDKIIKEIKKNKDAIYLLDRRIIEEKNNQLEKVAIKYIINNGKKIGNIRQGYISRDVYVLYEE